MPKKSLVGGLEVWKELGAVTEETGVQSLKQAKVIAIEHIRSNPNQPRKSSDSEALRELAESIRAFGLLQPIVVRPEGDDFLIVAGHRRYEACKLIGLKQIPCIVREAQDDELLEQSLVENIQREDINPIEEALCYRLLMEERQYSIRDMAARVHKSVGYLHGRLELLKYPDLAQSVREGKVGVFEARELAKVEREEERQDLTQRVVSGELDREGLKEIVQKRKGKAQQLTLFNVEAFSRHWQRLRRELEALDTKNLAAEQQSQTRQLLEEMEQTIEQALALME